MPSRSTVVVLTWLVVAGLAGVLALVAGVGGPGVVLLVVPGLSVLAPQLHLAALGTVEGVTPRRRVTAGLAVAAVLAGAFAASSASGDRAAYALAAGLAAGLLVGVEGYDAYRETVGATGNR